MVSSRKYLFLSVFVAGMSTMAVEFTASRMMQTIFGTSNIVWANVIGLVLLFLTVGYFIGGKVADKYPSPVLFYSLITAAGCSSVFFLLLTSVMLRTTTSTLAAYNASAVVASFVGVSIAIAVPITLLGCLSPFAIRLAVTDVKEAGQVSGRIYAVSTWGSLMGTYLPVLYVIPTAGSRVTAVIFGTTLMAVGLFGIYQEAKNHKQRAVATVICLMLIPFVLSWSQGNIKNKQSQVFETESPYNYVEVQRIGDCHYLLLNEGAVVHSEYCDNNRISRYSIYTVMTSAPLFTKLESLDEIKSMAIIGLGAGILPKRYMAAYGEMKIDGIEIDPAVVQAGRDYFEMNEPSLNVIVGDGRYELNKLKDKYDVIALDAYKPPYIPWHLTTVEFFEEIKARLNDNGSIAINTYRPLEDRRLVAALTATLNRVFPSVYTVDIGNYNTALIATVSPTDISELQKNTKMFYDHKNKVLRMAIHHALNGLVPTEASDIVFTDEIAPVETLIDSILLRMILSHATG